MSSPTDVKKISDLYPAVLRRHSEPYTVINKRHKGGQLLSLLFWLFLHSISVTGGRHYLFWPSLFGLPVTIC